MPGSPIRVSAEQGISEPAVLTEPLRVRAYEEREAHGLFDRLRLLIEQSVFLFRISVCGLVLSTLFAFLIPFQYEARTQLMPPDSETGSGLASLLSMNIQTGSSLGMLAGDMLGLKTSGALFMGILRSRTVEDRIIDTFDLRSVYGVRQMQDARRRLEANTQISEDRKSGIIGIGVTDHSPQRAAAIAQAYVSELDRMVVELNTSSAHRERIFLEERLKSVKQDLDSSAKEFSEFASKNTAIDIKEQGRAMVEAAATLQGRLIAAQSELEGLRQIYTPQNVRVRALQARIGELQKQLAQMGGGDLDSASGNSAEAQYPSIRKLPLLGVTSSDLYRKNKVQETLFELLTQQCELAKVQEAKETPSVRFLDFPVVPEKRSFPPRLFIMFVGTLFSLMLGTAWVLGKATWDDLDPQHPGRVLVRDVYLNAKRNFNSHLQSEPAWSRLRDKILRFKAPSKTL